MKKFLSKTVLISSIVLISSAMLWAQSSQISGTVHGEDGDPLVGVNIIVIGTILGTISDIDGNFNFTVKQAYPITIRISMVGYESQEFDVTEENASGLAIVLPEQTIMGQEVVISASRVEQSILESPVSVEKLGILAIKNTASDSYYKGIANLKGVDMVTSSINFQIFNARGFNSTSNTRFVQLVDNMNTQAPALNFPVGSLNGPSDIDVESIEFIPGASSALYGPNAFNGILLINSKNPFDYQGLSASAKFSMNHFGDSDLNSQDPVANPDSQEFGPGGAQPMYEVSLRYAKSFNNKFAFKVNFSYSKATDWYGTSLQDKNEALKPPGLSYNPGADRLHAFGDEFTLNLGLLKASSLFVSTAEGLGYDVNLLPDIGVSRTPYLERDIVDYDAANNLKYGAGVYYRITDKIELSYNYSYGGGTSVYTGAQRYSLLDFNIQSHKVELRGDNFFVRGYTTLENSGKSFIGDLTGVLINDSWMDNTSWFGAYGIGYLGAISGGLPAESAHNLARAGADTNRLDPVNNPQEFNAALEKAKNEVIPNGSLFADKSSMYHAEGQFNFKNQISFMDLMVGASYQLYNLNSNGTIFADKPGEPITISEYGGLIQGSKALLNDKLRLTASVRFDKNENFNGQVNPRVSAVLKVADGHNIRASFQTGFRNPTTQGQHIDLNVVSARLIGGLPFYREKHDMYNNGYTLASVDAFIEKWATEATGTGSVKGAQLGNPEYLSLLVPATEGNIPIVKPEKITSFELGYKSLINNKIMLDIVGYYNIYNDFIAQVRVRKAAGEIIIPTNYSNNPADANYWGYDPNLEQNVRNTQILLSPITAVGQENTFQTYTNFNETVTGAGAAFGLDYMVGKGYTVGFNYNWNRLIDGLGENFLNEYNTPEHKANISFSNRNVIDNLGFNVTYRWQNEFFWGATFGSGDVPAIGTLDAQVSYKLSGMRSILKLGGSNLFNTRHVLSYGGPTLGAIYYVSLTFDELLN